MATKTVPFPAKTAVFARTKINNSVVLLPGVVTAVSVPAEDAPKGTRTTYDVALEGAGGGTVTYQESALIPRG